MRILLLSICLCGAGVTACAQIKLPVAPASASQALQGLKNLQGAESGPTTKEIGQGLKEALDAGVATGVAQLSKVGGFAQSPAYRIPLPPEIKALEEKVRKNPLLSATMGPKLDRLVAAMNEGAEKAVQEAAPIFKEAIVNMTIQDAVGILQGGDGSATAYLKGATEPAVQEAFAPVIDRALKAVDIAKYWTPLVQALNANKGILGLSHDIETDLPTYVNQGATTAIYQEIAVQEAKIRKDPMARTSELLKKVFGSKLALG
jgi:hypothetical protein